MDDFHKLSSTIDSIKVEQKKTDSDVKDLRADVIDKQESLISLDEKLKILYREFGISDYGLDTEREEFDEDIISIIDEQIDLLFPSKDKISQSYALNKVDLLVSCLAGGISFLVDFLIVKTPNKIKIDGTSIEGSPLTNLMKQIGLTEDNKATKWVNNLEKWFHVDYDPSIKENVKGMGPQNHRIFSLGHDPSIMGLIWGVKDIVFGTFSYINKDGVLCIDKVTEADLIKIFYAPFVWLGHLISDLFTKAGLPIPGGCVLRTLQFGNLDEQNRTVGELVKHMYTSGYDLRHFAVASICNVVIELIIRVYMFLIGDIKVESEQILYEEEYNHIKNYRKKHKLLIISYAVASCGNIAKLAAYQGAPNAINLPIWYGLIKEAIVQFSILTNNSNIAIEAIENRHLIDERFAMLINMNKDF